MRTIIVVFTDRKVSLNEVSSYKKYKFLCNYDTISLYDMEEKRNIKVTLLSSSMALGRKLQTIQDISLAISIMDVVL